MASKIWKLCQRRLYSWLSSKCGLPLCMLGILVVITSAFQFGEVLLEWSKERYAVQFSIYADNIAGRSFEYHLSSPLPIDIVYTWVNGSDPILLEEIKQLKKSLARKTPANASNSTSPPLHGLSCPFNHCVPWRTLIMDASNCTQTLSIRNVGTVFPALQKGVVSFTFYNATKTHSSVYVVRLSSEDDVTSILKNGLVDHHGKAVAVTRGFLTSEKNLHGAILMDKFHIALSDGIRPLNTSKLFRKWMDTHFSRKVVEAEVKGNRTAVVALKSKEMSSSFINHTHHFSGERVTFHQAHLIWLPFTLPEGESDLERPDVVSASRFQDNEELRFSLRSVERFAPWVRHVFVVTNGQIPSWLNLDSPRITLVTHEDIFENRSHLPTYSSPSIESHLHRIPGLADYFIYLNDDVMFGNPVWPEDFYTHERGQKIYLSWPVPHCAEGCPPSWIRDKYCDTNCNNSACDWDGGDCVNATRPGPQGSHGYHSQADARDYCNQGCLNSWLGDRYCDTACRVLDCGYDAGDCGTEKWEELLSYNLKPSGGDFVAPLGTAALYLNLTEVFHNGTITEANYSPCRLIRTVIGAKKYSVLAITFGRNANRTTSNFTLVGTSGGETVTVNFTLTGDTVSQNETLLELKNKQQTIPGANNDTSSREFLEAVVSHFGDKLAKYWVEKRTPPPAPPSPRSTILTSYIVPNSSLLPETFAQSLEKLEKAWKDGEFTQRGYLHQKAVLLEQHLNLVVPNGTQAFGRPSEQNNGGGVSRSEGGGVEGRGDREGRGGGGRKEVGKMPAGMDHKHIELKKVDERPANGLSRKLLEATMEPPVLDWVESPRRLPWERLRLFPDTPTAQEPREEVAPYVLERYKSRRLMTEMTDTFADSLRYVNRLYTKEYGHVARKVPSHMPHFIQKEIMVALHEKFPEEFAITSSHKLRTSNDMQFSFSYMYYLMSMKKTPDLEEFFHELDLDNSGILSVRELRTMLAIMSKLPITHEEVKNLEDMLLSCNSTFNGTHPQVSEEDYALHYDPMLPLVTLEFTINCSELVEKMMATRTEFRSYKYEEIGEDLIGFKMITENATEVVMMLDELRKKRKKFICLNDNIDHSKKGADLAKVVLVDFYESWFPLPSQFELPSNYRNRFLHVHQLREWLEFKKRMNVALYIVLFLILLLCFYTIFYHRISRWKRRFTRSFYSLFSSRT